MRGGSYASDAVVGAVENNAFSKLSTNFTNAVPQKGGRKSQKAGSIASDAVIKAVEPKVFQGGKCPKGGRCPNCGKRMNGGTKSTTFESIMANASRVLSGQPVQYDTFAQKLQFRSEPAHVPQTEVVKLLDAVRSPATAPAPAPATAPVVSNVKSGGFGNRQLKNINEYMKKGSFHIFNKQFGGADGIPIGLKSDHAILQSNTTVGTAPNRIPSATTLNIIANEEIYGPHLMQKTSHFGNVTGVVEAKTSFHYGGNSKKKYPTAPRKTPLPKKKTKKTPSKKEAKKNGN